MPAGVAVAGGDPAPAGPGRSGDTVAGVGLASWIVVGLLAGWIAGLASGNRQQGCLRKIAVGVIGALLGGALARAAGYEGVTDVSLRSVLVAALGATLLLLVLGAIDGRRGSGS
ncbi:MAG TPA: GlsB/YeaQ/YmgE family stress response membrane protein [Acidimicrobiales bacterium]|nr:GlsB/YeaQ/YmgE family stress response membrane protein [Acidimicrobiales bacterium]